jgi:hypothetical protein
VIAATLQQVMAGDVNRAIALTDHPFLSMYVTNLGDRPGLLIDVDLPRGAVIEDGRGFDIVELASGARKRVLVRPTRAGAISPAFLGLVEFVYRETAEAGSRASAVNALLEAVHEFRAFFGKRADRLSEPAIRGLYAELELLLRLKETGLSAQDVLEAWSGPYRGTDLRFADESGIDVKSTRYPARFVQISSEHQMVVPAGGLHLFVRPLTTVSPDDSGGQAFLDVVATAKAVLVSTPATRALWDGAVQALGLDEADPYYRMWRFLPGEWRVYSVRDGFPSLTPVMLPTGVRSVSYSLELEAVESFVEEDQVVLEEVAAVYE